MDVGYVADLSTLDWKLSGGERYRYFAKDLQGIAKVADTVRSTWCLCSDLTVIDDGRAFANVPDRSIYFNSNGSVMVHFDTIDSDPTAAATALSGISFVYKLITPVTYTLTPQEITTLLGVNNVWCNDGTVKL